jgi:hypothetical protein
MKFGINIRKKITGAELSVRLFQLLSVLPVLYIAVTSAYLALVTEKGVLQALCEYGTAALPRAEAFLLSLLYRKTGHEVLVAFVLLAAALIMGFGGGAVLRAKHDTARAARWVYAALIAADLILRLLPLQMNRVFSLPAAVVGFAVRLACIVLILLDLYADGKAAPAQ